MVFGPGKARYDDHSLALYEAAGFLGAEAGQATATVFIFVLGNALGPAAAAALTRKLGRDGGNAEELMREHMAAAREIAYSSHGCAPAWIPPGVDYGAAPEKTFEFGLQAILDGLQAQLNTRRTPARHDQQPQATSPTES